MSYVRITIVSQHRKGDLVVPADEPVGALLPEVVTTLGEQVPGGRQLALATHLGADIDLATSLEQQAITNGSILYLTSIDDAPQPPVVVDTTDAVRDEVRTRSDAWGELASAVALCVVAALAALVGGAALLEVAPVANVWLAAVVAAVTIGAAWFGRREQSRVAAMGGAIAAGATVPVVGSFDIAEPFAHYFVLVITALWLVLGIVLGVGRNNRGALVGAAIGAVAGVVWFVALQLAWPLTTVAIIGALVSIAVIGVLPSIAIAMSGLGALDDRTISGRTVQRQDVQAAVASAFSAQSWSVLALSIPVTAALLALSRAAEPWSIVFVSLSSVTLALRARVFPLIWQRGCLFLAALLPLLGLVLTNEAVNVAARAVMCLVVVVVLIVAIAMRPSPLATAQLRRAANVVELLAVLALIPVAMGVLGIYTDLLAVFR